MPLPSTPIVLDAGGGLDVSRLHRDAIIALLRSTLATLQVDGAWEIYDGEVTANEDEVEYPYLVVWPAPADRSSARTLNGTTGAAETVTQITATGRSTDEVLAALDRAAAALERKIPPLTGRRFGPVSQVPGASPPQPQRDPQVSTRDGYPVYFSFIFVSLRSYPPTA